jgi:hypothetical protein
MRVILGLALFTMSPLLLSGAEPDPFLGKWKLNWDKSHSLSSAPKSAVRKYSKSGDGVHVSETWIDLSGKHQQVNYKANYDGRDYPVPTSKGHTVAFTKTDPFTVEGVSKSDGKVDYTFRRMVSSDRKTLTIELAKRDASGAPASEVLVYDKVK